MDTTTPTTTTTTTTTTAAKPRGLERVKVASATSGQAAGAASGVTPARKSRKRLAM